MKTYIITFKCALSNTVKAVEIENCATEINAKEAASAIHGSAIIITGVEVIEQGFEYFHA